MDSRPLFTLPDLPYDYDALGASISADIMHLHHDNHHQAYVDKLNAALENAPAEVRGFALVELLTKLDQLPGEIRTAVRNNGGGHYNHSAFWHWMAPKAGGQPTGELGKAITEKYGSFQAFVDQFSDEALKVFGSGWVWLRPDLSIIAMPNQDVPLLQGEPLLGLDVWEHAYYLDYKYKRADYVQAWWDVVNWEEVARRFAKSA